MHAHHAQGSKGDRAAEILKDYWQFKLLVMHLISLMHGVALARLRRDFKLSNLEVQLLPLSATQRICSASVGAVVLCFPPSI